MNRFRSVSEAFYPPGIKCVVCDGELPVDTRYCLCDKCVLSENRTFCEICGRPLPAAGRICFTCYDECQRFLQARAPFVFADRVRELVHRFKYGDGRFLAPVMAEFMADTYFESDWSADLITFVPIHEKRLRKRGYNQAQLLAEELGRRLALPVVPQLTKTVYTKNMARLNRRERLRLIRGSFRLDSAERVRGKKILLVDDVMTTGATTNECARMLQKGKCGEIYVLTFASVPVKIYLN